MGLRTFLGLVLFCSIATAQQPSGAARLKLGLDRLRTLGSVLMIAAHPDDENTALLAYMARGRHMRTAYLSLTRGEGGQNLIGSEQGELMGLIRTEELLAARRIDGAEQLFTRAIDFGFSKTAEETLAKWGREEVLGDVVWAIRKFQPDIVVLRFSGTPRDGHGHHQSSAILGKEAFEAAADPARYPEQLKRVNPWKARRLYFNFFSFGPRPAEPAASAGRIDIDTGEYSALLGSSYGEIAGISRSQHRSQGMGSAERRGSSMNTLTLIAGEPASKDVFEGIDTSWSRVAGGGAVADALTRAAAAFDIENPQRMLPALGEARQRMSALDHPWAKRKLRECDELIAEAAGIWADATSAAAALTPGGSTKVAATVVVRAKGVAAKWNGVEWDLLPGVAPIAAVAEPLPENQPVRREAALTVSANHPPTQPYWLRKPSTGTMYAVEEASTIGDPQSPPLVRARFRLEVAGTPIEIERDVVYRWVDPVRGELTRSVQVMPAVAVSFPQRALVFPDGSPKKVEVQVRAEVAKASGQAALEAPPGWKVAPPSLPFESRERGEAVSLEFEVTPPAAAGAGELAAVAKLNGGEIRHGVRIIDYDHIPRQTLYPPARVAAVRAEVKLLARRIGYVMGAGDDVPGALRQLGAEVTLLDAEELARGDLRRFDAIVTGVRAFNTRRDLAANLQRLLEFVAQGGTLVAQYNVLERPFGGAGAEAMTIGPFPIRVGRDRVSVEEAKMQPVSSDHPLLQAPNRIVEADYEGWVQERGLYFASEWDSRYQPVWEMHDPGEKPSRGGTLYARHGKGVYVFTALSWFRQLPAGVPGAYRIFANFLSAGKASQ